MALTRTKVTRSGVEYHEVELKFDESDADLIEKLTQTGKPVPEVVILVWMRHIPYGWHRVITGPRASRAIGHVKSARGPEYKGSRKAREIFDRQHGALLPWAELLPGLRTAVEEAHLYLPD
jgi:hypothetical protein